MKNSYLLFILVTTLFMGYQSDVQNNLSHTLDEKQMLSPDERFGALFEAVQTQIIFPDSKTFVDCTPKFSTQEILDNYDKAKSAEGFSLKAFVMDNFELPKKYASDFKADTKLANKIKDNWLAVNQRVFKNTGKMVEKYNVVDMELESGGGEYPVQDGFGWTNGIYLKMLEEGKDK